MAIFSTARMLLGVLFIVASLAWVDSGALAAAQERSAVGLTPNTLLGLAKRGDFETADHAIERNLSSPRPDFELLWQYQSFLVNQASQPSRAATLGEKWLPTVRHAKPKAQGRILKETALGILFGSFRQTHAPAAKARARRLLEECVEVNPTVSEAFIHLALLSALEGQPRVAVSMLDRAVEGSTDRSQREQLSSMLASARSDATVLLNAARRVYQIAH